MSSLTIGIPIVTYDLFITRRAPQSFQITWLNGDGTPATSLNGKTVRIIVGDRESPTKEYDAVAASNVTSFALTSEDTNFTFNRYDGLIVRIDGADETPLVDLSVTVGPY